MREEETSDSDSSEEEPSGSDVDYVSASVSDTDCEKESIRTKPRRSAIKHAKDTSVVLDESVRKKHLQVLI